MEKRTDLFVITTWSYLYSRNVKKPPEAVANDAERFFDLLHNLALGNINLAANAWKFEPVVTSAAGDHRQDLWMKKMNEVL